MNSLAKNWLTRVIPRWTMHPAPARASQSLKVSFFCPTLGLLTLLIFSANVIADEPQTKPLNTELCTATTLITAEMFDRPESLSPKGKPGWRGGIGEWSIVDGVLNAKDEKPNDKRPNGHEAVCEFPTEAKNIVFFAEFKLGEAPHVGFVCRDTQKGNHHLGRIMVTPQAVWLQSMSGIAKQTKKQVLQKIDTQFDPNHWYQVAIEVCGDTWLAHVGEHTLKATDTRFQDTKGRIGMVAKGDGAQFKNVAIWRAEAK